MNNKDLVLRKTGQVQLKKELLTIDQQETFEKVYQIIDKNPKIVWRRDRFGKIDPDHNMDFCLIEGKIEPVKSFCVKAQLVAGLSVQNIRDNISGDGIETRIISTVRVWKPGIDRAIEMSGASTVRECGGARSKPNKRAFHDCLARAQTRAFKLAMESFLGFPFINMAIMKLFGGYELNEQAPEIEIDPKVLTLRKRIRANIDKAATQLKIDYPTAKKYFKQVAELNTESELAEMEYRINKVIDGGNK